MADAPLRCPDCQAAFDALDNYCRQCGMFLAAATGTATALTAVTQRSGVPAPYRRERAQLPAPVRRAATAVAVGAALQVGLGIASRLIAAQAGQKAARAVVTAAPGRARRRELVPQPEAPGTVEAVAETVIVRRVWVRGPRLP
jgi:hypothetical protein